MEVTLEEEERVLEMEEVGMEMGELLARGKMVEATLVEEEEERSLEMAVEEVWVRAVKERGVEEARVVKEKVVEEAGVVTVMV